MEFEVDEPVCSVCVYDWKRRNRQVAIYTDLDGSVVDVGERY